MEPAPLNPQEQLQQEINAKLEKIMQILTIKKVYYVDDAFELNTGKDEFKGLIYTALQTGKIEQLRQITLQGINFNIEEAVLLDHIDSVWEEITFPKQLKYFERVYDVIGTESQVVDDYRKSNTITRFFKPELIELLKPFEWDEKKQAIFDSLDVNEKIIVFIDQDLKHAKGGRYSKLRLTGEDLIAEVKQSGSINKCILILFTHTIQDHHNELTRRKEILQNRQDLKAEDFLALKKGRLQNPSFFADGIKKACLNKRFEQIKNKTQTLFEEARVRTSGDIDELDTYDFDEVILKSSVTEGVWEAETFIRVYNIYLSDNFKKKIDENGYTQIMNKEINIAKEVGKIEFELKDNIKPNSNKYYLRHKELYEDGDIINKLRLGTANGDIFKIHDGNQQGEYILIAQECDLMVRNDGSRGSNHGYLFKIDVLTKSQLLSQIQNRAKKGEQFFADKFELGYYQPETNISGIIRLSEGIVINLNVLDLVAFNKDGESELKILDPLPFESDLYNTSWCNRYDTLLKYFTDKAKTLEKVAVEIEKVDAEIRNTLKNSVNIHLAFNDSYGKNDSYKEGIFNFGIKRIRRLREASAKTMLEKFARFLSRTADLHDFAK